MSIIAYLASLDAVNMLPTPLSGLPFCSSTPMLSRFLPNTHLHHGVFFPLPSVLFFFLLFFHLHTSTLLFFPPLCLGDITGFTSKLSRTNLATAHISGKIKLNRFSTQDCGSILEYPRSHLHLSDSLTHSSFRRKFQITGTDLEPKTLVNSRLFLGCPYYTAITLSPGLTPASLIDKCKADVPEDNATACFTPIFSLAIRSTSSIFFPTVDIQLVSYASVIYFNSSPCMVGDDSHTFCSKGLKFILFNFFHYHLFEAFANSTTFLPTTFG